VSLGKFYAQMPIVFLQNFMLPFSFGLLHRIPPIPDDRRPGSLPQELRESAEFEGETLYVPADVTSDPLDFEFSSDAYDQPQPLYSPPLSYDYSHTYSNRGVALTRQSQSTTIPEEYEGTDSHPHSARSSQDVHISDSNHYHRHHDNDHDRDHGYHNHRLGSPHRGSTRSPSLTPDVHSNGDSRP
jgi:hypothetical protein